MFSKLIKNIGFAAIMAAGLIGTLATTEAGSFKKATYAAIGPSTSVPFGWADFCKRYKGECDTERLPALDVNLTTAALREIERINTWVNTNIEPVSDKAHWGVEDRWDYPTDGKGDCEDYVLLKRKLLIDLGFPRQALLVTVVKDEKNEGHAVLTLKTNKGEFALDNPEAKVLPWNQTGYRFVKRQSQEDPNVWVQIGEPISAPLYTAR